MALITGFAFPDPQFY